MLKEFLSSFGLAVAIFSFVLLMANVFKITDLIINRHVEIRLVMKFLVYNFSHLLSYVIPMSMLTASLMFFGRISSDHEVVAMKAGGLSLGQILKPFIVLGLLVSSFLLWFNYTLTPQATYRNLLFLKDLTLQKPTAMLEERVFNESFDNFIVYVNKIDGFKLKGVKIWELKEEGTPRVITAQQGEFIPSPEKNILVLKLGQGSIEEVYEKDSVKYHKMDFNNHFIQLSCSRIMDGAAEKRAKDMTYKELKRKMAELKSKGVDISPLLTENYQRQALSFASLPFILVGASLVIKTRRGSRSFGFGLSLVVFIIYYLLLMLGETLGRKGLNPFLSMWAANIIWGGVGLVMVGREARM